MKKLSLNNLLALYVLITSLVVFPFLYFKVTSVFNSHFEHHIKESAKTLANQTFNSMYQIMKKGWSRNDLIEFLRNLNSIKEGFYIEIYRTKIVEELFGKIKQPPMDEKLNQAIKQNKEIIVKDKNFFRYILPVVAKEECTKCHINAKKGDVLGLVEIKYNFEKKSVEAKKDFASVMLYTIPLPMFFILFFGYLITRKVKLNISKINHIIKNANKMKDLEELDKENIKFFIKEFDELVTDSKNLVRKLSSIAIDKNILEFEIKILEKFILTSDVVKDWKDYINNILIETNNILPIYCIFSIFEEDEKFEVNIFWLGNYSVVLKEKIENLVKEKINDKFHITSQENIEIFHNVARKDIELLDNLYSEIEYETRTLILDKPKIGGIIGIGVHSSIKHDKTKLIVIESILSTLLNVIGSVKAINIYTKELEFYATRDPLTSLYNQRVFWELANYEVQKAKRKNYKFSLIVLDIDNFKSINDIYGHKFGDKVLIHIANFLHNNLRPSDIIARYGGDEFTVILPETDLATAYVVAKRLLENAEKFNITTPDGKIIHPMFSIGISTFPDHSNNMKDLFSLADTMVYKAKTAGKNQIKIPTEEDLEEYFKKENELSLKLIDAIHNKKVIPYFQPIVNLKTSKIEAYEILARLKFDGEIIPAAKFIEIAERTGLVFKMDLILIEEALKKLKNRKEKLFINLSPKSFIVEDYLAKVKELVDKYDTSPERIVFEITERDTVRNVSLLQNFVSDLKNMGFKFAIDDFGSGYSSYFYVKQFPIDYVKIEGDFIKNLLIDEKDKAFVESIITLCKRLKIKTIAEFVEDEKTLETIKKMDVDYGQGFYLGKPLPNI